MRHWRRRLLPPIVNIMAKSAAKQKTTDRTRVRRTRGTRPGKTGRPDWEPALQMFRRDGMTGLESQEQAWERTRNWVRHCVSIGIQHELIAVLVQPPCALNTLKKYFKPELEFGKAHQTAIIAAKVVQSALNGSEAQARFWLETQAGWSRKVDVNQNGVLIIKTISGDEGE